MHVLWPFLALYRRHWLLITSGIALAIITLLASIGLLALSGWFLAASSLAGPAGLYTFNYLLPAAGVRAAAIIRTIGRYTERLVSHDATFRVLTHLRTFTFQKILPLSPAGIARFRQGELLNRLVADVDTLDHLYLRVISPLFSALLIIAVATIALSTLDLSLALTLGAIMSGLLLLLPLIFYHVGKPIGVGLTKLRSQYRYRLTTWLEGQAELSIFSALGRFRADLTEIEQRWVARQQQQAALSGIAQALMILASGLTVTLILWLAADGIGDDNLSGAYIALFVFASLAVFETLAPVAGAFQHLGHVIASATRVAQLIAQQPTVVFPAIGPLAPAKIALELIQVSFTYPNQPLSILKNISLSLAAGEHVALLGRTGCGKSTLLQLVTRAWEVQQGSIKVNGQLLSVFNESSLRQMMVVVSQRVHIFSATLRENLQLANPAVNDSQLTEVLTQVGLKHLFDNTGGLNTWLGDGGRPVSGGEQRRLGIARALLHPAPLLLLDEPTEGLDAKTEQQILTLLLQHARHKTLIMVTHRLYGLEYMDRICVMEDGHIVEQGDHQTLLSNKRLYYQFQHR